MITDGLLTIKEAAAFKKMAYEAFRYYCVEGRGPHREKWNGRWVFSVKDLSEWNVDKVRKRRKKSDA